MSHNNASFYNNFTKFINARLFLLTEFLFNTFCNKYQFWTSWNFLKFKHVNFLYVSEVLVI